MQSLTDGTSLMISVESNGSNGECGKSMPRGQLAAPGIPMTIVSYSNGEKNTKKSRRTISIAQRLQITITFFQPEIIQRE